MTSRRRRHGVVWLSVLMYTQNLDEVSNTIQDFWSFFFLFSHFLASAWLRSLRNSISCALARFYTRNTIKIFLKVKWLSPFSITDYRIVFWPQLCLAQRKWHEAIRSVRYTVVRYCQYWCGSPSFPKTHHTHFLAEVLTIQDEFRSRTLAGIILATDINELRQWLSQTGSIKTQNRNIRYQIWDMKFLVWPRLTPN